MPELARTAIGDPVGTGTSATRRYDLRPQGTWVPDVTKADGANVAGGGAPAAALAIESASITAGDGGSWYTFVLQASGGTPPYTWSKTGDLPTGLTLAATGLISGIPTETGAFPVTYTVTDDDGTAVSAALSLTVAGFGPLDLTANLVSWYQSSTLTQTVPVRPADLARRGYSGRS